MAKGMFTQGVALLTDGRTGIEDIRSALEAQGFQIVKEVSANEQWCFGGPTLIVPFRPEVNGYVAVDVVNQLWPDAMGDPKKDPMVFGAWSMGYFGPYAFPGGLTRARQHAQATLRVSRTWIWQEGRTVPERHRGFIRIKLSYVFGAKGDAPIIPRDYDPVAEMLSVSRVVLALLEAPGVLCYFNPGGEVLRDRPSFREFWEGCEGEDKLPIALWSNVRFFRLSDKLSFMDTVGNSQLDLRDVEAVFPLDNYEPGDLDYYLRNVTHYLLGLDRDLKTGEAIDGPGETDLSWTIESLEKPTIEPPRLVLRLYPKAIRKAVQAALSAVGRAPA